MVSNTNELKFEATDSKKYLTDVAATDISIVRQPNGFKESAEAAQEGAKVARQQIEKSTDKPTVSKLNAKNTG